MGCTTIVESIASDGLATCQDGGITHHENPIRDRCRCDHRALHSRLPQQSSRLLLWRIVCRWRCDVSVKATTPEEARDAIAKLIENLRSTRQREAFLAERKHKKDRLTAQESDLAFILEAVRTMKFEPHDTIGCDGCATPINCYEIGCTRKANNT
jgi:hypothetical protein